MEFVLGFLLIATLMTIVFPKLVADSMANSRPVRCLSTVFMLAFAGVSQRTPMTAAEQDWGRTFSAGDFTVTMDITGTMDSAASISLDELMTEKVVPKEARKLFEKALKSDRKGKHEEALERVRAAIAIAPNFFQAHAALAVAYMKRGQTNEAEREVDVSLRLNPDYVPGQEILGLVLLSQGNLREAAEILDHVVEMAPSRKTAHYYLGQALLRMGNPGASSEHLKRAEFLLRHPPQPFPTERSDWLDPTTLLLRPQRFPRF
ncbi:MAG: tetratricopeptide repeat protein [Bryobacteraceae bacterium]